MELGQLKKIIIGLIVTVIAVLLIALLWWWLWLRPDTGGQPTGDATATSTTGRLPDSGSAGTSSLPGDTVVDGGLPGGIDVPNPDQVAQPSGTEASRNNRIDSIGTDGALAPTVSQDKSNLQLYDRYDGKFYQLDNQGNKQSMSDASFPDARSVAWSPDKSKAVIAFPDSSKIIYDFNAQKQTTLPKHWEDITFSPSGNSLAFKSFANDGRDVWLGIVDADGSNARAIEKLGDNAYKAAINWSPSGQIVATFADGSGYDNQKVYFIGQNQENLPSMSVNGRGFISQWSPDGSRLLYSVYSAVDNYAPSLWIAGINGDTVGASQSNLELSTFANKCTFINASQLYCAVPRSMPQGAGLMPALADKTIDDLYFIDLDSGQQVPFDLPGEFNVSNLNYVAADNSLYFIDRLKGNLRKLELSN